MAREMAMCVSAPEVMWACVCGALFHGISHQSNFVNTVCCDTTVIQGATDLLQQPELCK